MPVGQLSFVINKSTELMKLLFLQR